MENELILRTCYYDNHKKHKLVYTGENNLWTFVPAEDWMPIRILYDEAVNGVYKNINGFDSDGFGMPVYIGDIINEKYIVDKLIDKANKLYVALKEIE